MYVKQSRQLGKRNPNGDYVNNRFIMTTIAIAIITIINIIIIPFRLFSYSFHYKFKLLKLM